ncbi:DUF1877 family protein [uncultured Dokdonia sp.]|uniref:DUF1877 family protein n=1 Tax=uncultured Dokdonia sp. TaxID=575653 RepID=UPI00260FB28A|nr:DUF1877 family protein [uncultured Dokdonia sp.]
MAIDISLIAVPIQITAIFQKINDRQDSEYGDALFSLPNAFESDFNDFGHPDWIDSKQDLQQLLQYYPTQTFESKYYVDLKRVFGVLEYLIAHYKNDESISFFNDGLPISDLRSGQGFLLKYWNQEILKNKRILIENIQYDDLIKQYNYKKMEASGVYKISQIHAHKNSIKFLFLELKEFMKHAEALGGFVIISST